MAYAFQGGQVREDPSLTLIHGEVNLPSTRQNWSKNGKLDSPKSFYISFSTQSDRLCCVSQTLQEYHDKNLASHDLQWILKVRINE